jgi:hypothetical protein
MFVGSLGYLCEASVAEVNIFAALRTFAALREN